MKYQLLLLALFFLSNSFTCHQPPFELKRIENSKMSIPLEGAKIKVNSIHISSGRKPVIIGVFAEGESDTNMEVKLKTQAFNFTTNRFAKFENVTEEYGYPNTIILRPGFPREINLVFRSAEDFNKEDYKKITLIDTITFNYKNQSIYRLSGIKK